MGKDREGQSDSDLSKTQENTRTSASRPFLNKDGNSIEQIVKWFLYSLPTLEWMKLIVAPLILAGAGILISNQLQKEASQNATLKAYFDKLETLTFDHKLLTENPDNGAIVLARGRTIAALRELDQKRREELIAFLQASGLLRLDRNNKQQEPVISFKGQNLFELSFRRMDLTYTDFRNAKLNDVDLSYTNLGGADLSNAVLNGADLNSAVIRDANLSHVVFNKANLRSAILSNTDLSNAVLLSADFSESNLEGANLKGARLNFIDPSGGLRRAGIPNINFSKANLSGANLSGIDLSTVKHLTEEQLTLAKLCHTKLPPDIELDPDRDCKELGL